MLSHTIGWAEGPPENTYQNTERVCDRPTCSAGAVGPSPGAQVSRIDELVYGFALGRFYRDASKANIQLARRA